MTVWPALTGAIAGGIVALLVGFLLEPFKQKIAFKTKRRELRFSYSLHKQLDCLEALNQATQRVQRKIVRLRYLYSILTEDAGAAIAKERPRTSRMLDRLSAMIDRDLIYLPSDIKLHLDNFVKSAQLLVDCHMFDASIDIRREADWDLIDGLERETWEHAANVLLGSRGLARSDDDGPIGN